MGLRELATTRWKYSDYQIGSLRTIRAAATSLICPDSCAHMCQHNFDRPCSGSIDAQSSKQMTPSCFGKGRKRECDSRGWPVTVLQTDAQPRLVSFKPPTSDFIITSEAMLRRNE